MSVQALSWVFENSESRLGPRHVLLSIANHADRYGRNAFPSVRTIAREARLSPREVQYAIPILVDLGELLSERGAGPGGTNLYSLPKMGAAKSAYAKSAEGVQTGVQNPTRNKEEQKQPSTKTLPNPPLQGGNKNLKLSRRDHTRIARWIQEADRPNDIGVGKLEGVNWADIIRLACLDLMIPLEDAMQDLLAMDEETWSARLELTKPAQAASGT